MQFTSFLSRMGQAERRASRRSFKPLTVAATALFMGLAWCGHATPVCRATKVFVSISGSYKDVTSELVTTDGHTYVMDDTTFEIVLDYIMGHVYDLDGDLIGYMQSNNPPGP